MFPKIPLRKAHLDAAHVLWEYHHVNHEVLPADLIMVLCSNDLRVADRAAQLYHQGAAPRILFSGGLGNFTKGVFDRAEALIFADRAIDLNVPEADILAEDRSTNTGENVRYSRELLINRSLSVNSVIAVQKPIMERRTAATLDQLWPGMSFTVTSPQIPFADYPTESMTMSDVIHIMVGDFQRILEYPLKGWMSPQPVSGSALTAYQFLVEEGFDGHLIHHRAGE